MVNATGKNNFEGTTRSLFNTVCSENGIKWPQLSKNGNTIAEDVSNFAKDNGMYLRGHYLWCDYAVPDLLDLVGNEDELQEGTMAYIYNEYKNKNITEEQANEQIETIKKELEKRVINHVKDLTIQFPSVNEWDVINESIAQEYFKFYLYDKNFLTNSKFLTTDERNTPTSYIDNNEYYEFMAKCFDVARENNPNAKLVLNENKFNGGWENFRIDELIRVINNIKRYTDNIDYIGIQYHIKNAYNFTPQSYYNKINYLLNQTGVEKAVITEYDNYISGEQNNYTDEEIKEKADYLRDSLIAQYSNMNVSEFTFWVYNSGTGSFSNEERQAYEELMQNWLNDKQNGLTKDSGILSTRLYKGEYTATIEFNGVTKEVPIKVSDDTGTVEVVLEGDLFKYEENLNELVEQYNNFENLYSSQIDSIANLRTEIENVKNDISSTTYQTSANTIIDLLDKTYNIGNKLIESKNMENVGELLKAIEMIGKHYKELLLSSGESVEVDVADIESRMYSISNLVDSNTDLDIQDLIELKDIAWNYYNDIKESQNNIKKFNYISTTHIIEYIDKILNEKIDKYIEAYPITLTYYPEINNETYVNRNVTVTVNIGNDTQIINNDGRNKLIFTENGDYIFYYKRRGREGEEYKIKAEVNCIDKNSPQIIDVEKNKVYTNSIAPIAKDKEGNLEKVELYANEKLVNTYKNGQAISEEGIYRMIATDKAKNITQVQFQIIKNQTSDYLIHGNYVKNIKGNTSLSDFMNNSPIKLEYSIKRKGKDLNKNEKVATGDILEVKNTKQKYTVIVAGDINGDGEVRAKDLTMLRSSILGKTKLNEIQTLAADTNVDGKAIGAKDLVRMRILILNGKM